MNWNLVGTRYPSVPIVFYFVGTRYPSVPKNFFLVRTWYPSVQKIFFWLVPGTCRYLKIFFWLSKIFSGWYQEPKTLKFIGNIYKFRFFQFSNQRFLYCDSKIALFDRIQWSACINFKEFHFWYLYSTFLLKYEAQKFR